MTSASARILAERTMSAFDLSIGTSFSFESLFQGPKPTYDAEREKPPIIPIDNYDELWLNVATLYRNILQAIPTAVAVAAVSPGDTLDALLDEMERIKDIMHQATHDRMRVVFYHSAYDGMAVNHPQAKLRIAKTPKQAQYNAERDQVLGQLLKAHTKDFDIQAFRRGLKPPRPGKRALVLTHYAYDLLSASQFGELHLLESHTGLLKKKASFYTKLTKPSHGDLVRVPFNVATIQVFGDSQTFFAMGQDVRQQVMDLAQTYQWHAMTTPDRLRLGFSLMKDRFTGEILSSMLNESV